MSTEKSSTSWSSSQMGPQFSTCDTLLVNSILNLLNLKDLFLSYRFLSLKRYIYPCLKPYSVSQSC